MNALPARQRGVAVLTAMLVVTIATVIAVNLLWETGVDLQRTENLLLKDQAREYCLGGEAAAVILLEDDARNDGPEGRDDLGEAWAKLAGQPPFPIEGGELRGTIDDLQGRFNLNNLIDGSGKPREEFVEQFQRLLLALPLETPIDPGTAATLTDRIVDWLDPDTVPGLDGAEDDLYTSRQPPQRAANFWFVSVSELLAIEGMTAELYAALEPNVAALPPPTSAGDPTFLNVNTAPAAVLASLATTAGIPDVQEFVGQAYDDKSQFVDDFQLAVQGYDQRLTPWLATGSRWFRATVTTSIGPTRATLYSLIERRAPNDLRVRLRSYDVS